MSNPDFFVEHLTDREHDVLVQIADGLTNAEIADQLFLAKSTVKWYVRQLNSKLNTNNRDEIVERAQELGLLGQYQSAVNHNLPEQPTVFIGRRAEIEALTVLITNPEMRLLTILAQGGMGKTRVALEVGQQQVNRFRDGVYFVALQEIADIDEIVPTIANAIGYQFRPNSLNPEQELLDYLNDKQMLLIMDNWEHLLPHVEILNQILAASNQIEIIVTSRERLNLTAETVYMLDGMQVTTEITVTEMLNTDAVQFFMQRAQHVQPDFALDDTNMADVQHICRLTQGMPLAIMLAASWLDVLTLAEISAEIQKQIDFLDTEMRDIPERHRSIRAVFDATWSQLSTDEQQVFMALSAFRGGFAYAAVAAITGANIRALQSLMNKALIARNEDKRYYLHELLRQYSAEKQSQHIDSPTLHLEHSRYYLQFLADQHEALQDERIISTLQVIDAELNNIVVAWRYNLETSQDVDLLNAAIDSLWLYIILRGYQATPLALLQRTVAVFKDTPNHPIYYRALTRGNYALEPLTVAYKLAQEQKDVSETIFCLLHLAQYRTHALAQFEGALNDLNQCFQLCELGATTTQKIQVLIEQTWCYVALGQPEQAQHTVEVVLAMIDASHNLGQKGRAYREAGNILYMTAQYDAAKQAIENGRQAEAAIGNYVNEAWHYTILGEIEFLEGQIDTGYQLQARALALVHNIRTQTNVSSHAHVTLSLTASLQGDARYGLYVAQQTELDATTAFLLHDIKWAKSVAAIEIQDYSLARLSIYDALKNSANYNSPMLAISYLPPAAILLARSDEHTLVADIMHYVQQHSPANDVWVNHWEAYQQLGQMSRPPTNHTANSPLTPKDLFMRCLDALNTT